MSDGLLTLARAAFSKANPLLSNYSAFQRSLAQEVKMKPGENIQYGFDIVLDELFATTLASVGLAGETYSEERGWFQNGVGERTVVYDPFCNSTLASKSVYDAAGGVTVFDHDGNLSASMVVDYQTGVVGLFHGGSTRFYQAQDGSELVVPAPAPKGLSDAWIAVAFERTKDRAEPRLVADLVAAPARISVGSGHVYWLRLAMGVYDGYADPIGGEPLYEMFASAIAIGTGCTVGDRSGTRFDHAAELARFKVDPSARYYPVAARDENLRQTLVGICADYAQP